MAVLLPGKFLFLAHPHTASTAMTLALQDTFPEALDLRPHHMLLDEARGRAGTTLVAVMQGRKRVWDHRPHKRRDLGDPAHLAALPEGLATLHTGRELVWSVVRNPYDLLVTCFLRKGQGRSFENFLATFSDKPWVMGRRLYYHAPGSAMVLRYETLQDDLDRLSARLNLPRIEPGRHNETVNKAPWESYYGREAYEIVNRRFGDEVRTYYELRSE